ncbi:MAG: hypothetical protein DMF78_22255, partial [Acidobacteria bacterium]
ALKATGVFDLNYLRASERNVVHIDPREGRSRRRQDAALEEAFAEAKLADLSPNFDVVSVRAGIQPFVSDFRGLVFSDTNLGARLFGNASNNRWQYNLAAFDLLEKDTNSELNTFERRHQRVYVANVFHQDTFTHGYQLSLSFHRSEDRASDEFHYDGNGFLVRPARIGTPRLHDLSANYVGLAGDGHLGRINVSHAAYYAFGTDDDHPLAGHQDIRAGMGALEASIDKDWTRFKATVFYASGDDDPLDGKARGFDSIYDSSNFAGGPFSFWVRSGIALTQTAVLLKAPGSLLPDLRSNKFEGQANFVPAGDPQDHRPRPGRRCRLPPAAERERGDHRGRDGPAAGRGLRGHLHFDLRDGRLRIGEQEAVERVRGGQADLLTEGAGWRRD